MVMEKNDIKIYVFIPYTIKMKVLNLLDNEKFMKKNNLERSGALKRYIMKRGLEVIEAENGIRT